MLSICEKHLWLVNSHLCLDFQPCKLSLQKCIFKHEVAFVLIRVTFIACYQIPVQKTTLMDLEMSEWRRKMGVDFVIGILLFVNIYDSQRTHLQCYSTSSKLMHWYFINHNSSVPNILPTHHHMKYFWFPDSRGWNWLPCGKCRKCMQRQKYWKVSSCGILGKHHEGQRPKAESIRSMQCSMSWIQNRELIWKKSSTSNIQNLWLIWPKSRFNRFIWPKS